MTDIVIVEAVRSAVGRAHKGSLAQTRPDELAGEVIAALLARVPAGEAADGRGPRPRLRDARGRAGAQHRARRRAPRRAARASRARRRSTASARAACRPSRIAAGAIAIGSNDIVIAGGVESMTMVPMTGNKLSASPEAMRRCRRRSTRRWASPRRTSPTKFNIARADQDAFALGASRRRRRAQKAGTFDQEIVPVTGDALRGRQANRVRVQARRAGPRATRRSRASPRSSRRSRRRARVTAGNSSPLSDGAAAALVMSKAKADALGHQAARLLPRVRDGRRRSGDHGHRPDPGGAEAPREDRADDRATSTSSRSTRPSRARPSTCSGARASRTRSST